MLQTVHTKLISFTPTISSYMHSLCLPENHVTSQCDSDHEPYCYNVIDRVGVGPSASQSVSLTRSRTFGDCLQYPLTADCQRSRQPRAVRAWSVENRSVTCPTRFEIRTEESVRESLVVMKSRGAVKSKVVPCMRSTRVESPVVGGRGAIPARLVHVDVV